MKINYWQCEYNTYDDSELYGGYTCNHPDNEECYCDLNNKWYDREEYCVFLKGIEYEM